MAQAIILAGGYSSRTSINKMHFIVGNKPLLMHTIESIMPIVSKVIVVTGHHDKDIRSFIDENDKIKIIYNRDYDRGMFSSVLTGAKAVDEDFFILPGDIPFIKKETFKSLLKGTKSVRYPTYKGKEGHPLFLKKELKTSLLNEPIDSNLKAFRDKQDKEAIEVDDKYILRDVDTDKEFEELMKEKN